MNDQLLTISCQVGLVSLHSRRGYGVTSARQLSTDTVKRKKPNLNLIGFNSEGQFPSIRPKREIGVEPGTSGQTLNRESLQRLGIDVHLPEVSDPSKCVLETDCAS